MIGYAFKQKKTFAQYLVNHMRNGPMDNIVSYDSTYDFMEIFLKKRHRTKRLKEEQNELEYVIFDFSF